MKSKRNASIIMIVFGLVVLIKYVFNIDLSYSKRDIANILICFSAIIFIVLGFVSLNNVIKKEKSS